MPDLQTAPQPSAWSPAGVPVEAVRPLAGSTLTIGLVNNLRGAGFRDADRQFRALLEAAGPAGAAGVTVRGYGVMAEAADMPAFQYRPVAAIASDRPDCLIMTGAEPRTPDLRDEPFYPALTWLIDHAIERRIPVLFSCLASHVAVLHLSGVARRRLARKCHGVLRFEVRGEHPLLHGTTRQGTGGHRPRTYITVPHSRWNSLDEAALTARGYTVLAASDRGGVDCFVHDDAPGCVFLQGHPEYDAASLALEYRRDVRRYLTGETPNYPTMPVGCFNAATRSTLWGVQRAARGFRDPTALDTVQLPTGTPGQPPPWRDGAVRLYRNWLDAVMLGQRSTVAAM